MISCGNFDYSGCSIIDASEEEREHSLRQVQLLHQQEASGSMRSRLRLRLRKSTLRRSQGTTLTPAELQSWQRYHQVLSQRIAAQQDVVAQAAQVVEEQRQQLLVARQETKVIEKLRDKAQQRALLEHTRREQQLLDELALMRSPP